MGDWLHGLVQLSRCGGGCADAI